MYDLKLDSVEICVDHLRLTAANNILIPSNWKRDWTCVMFLFLLFITIFFSYCLFYTVSNDCSTDLAHLVFYIHIKSIDFFSSERAMLFKW